MRAEQVPPSRQQVVGAQGWLWVRELCWQHAAGDRQAEMGPGQGKHSRSRNQPSTLTSHSTHPVCPSFLAHGAAPMMINSFKTFFIKLEI